LLARVKCWWRGCCIGELGLRSASCQDTRRESPALPVFSPGRVWRQVCPACVGGQALYVSFVRTRIVVIEGR
jgi:hypothetical protein